MNLNAIKRNCKARRTARVFNATHGGQWISDGQSAFLVDGLRVDEEAVAALFNLTQKQRTNMYMGESTTSDPRFTFTPLEGEEHTDEAGAMVWDDNEVYVAIPSSRGTLWIPHAAIRHIKPESRRYAVRWRRDRPLVAVYGDLFCQVLIMPLSNVFTEPMRKRAGMMSAPTYQWPDLDREAAEAEEAAEALLKKIDAGEADDEPGGH